MPDECRRAVLRLTGSVLGAGALATLSGCSDVVDGVTNDPALSVVDTELKSHDLSLELEITVENSASERRDATLMGEIDFEGGSAVTNSQSITPRPESTNVYDMYFRSGAMAADASYTGDAWIE